MKNMRKILMYAAFIVLSALSLTGCSGGGGGNAGTVPSAPINIGATAGNGQNTITWEAAPGATSYNLYWSTIPGTARNSGTKIPDVTSPYVHTGLTNGTTYYYVITGQNNVGEGEGCIEFSVRPYIPHAPPTGVAALAGDGQVRLAWNLLTDSVLTYSIYFSTTPGVTPSNGTRIIINNPMSDTYTHPGLNNGTT